MDLWKDIPNFEGLYQASVNGQIKKVSNENKIMRFSLNQSGYLQVRLSKNGKAKTYRVNRLIALTFIKNPLNKRTVNHINGIKTDNRVENLEWATEKEQAIHRHKILGIPTSDCSACHKANLRKVIRDDGKIYNSIKEAKEDLNKPHAHIVEVCEGKLKSVYGFKFKYLEV